MEILIPAAAPTRAQALAMMAALGIAEIVDGEPRAIVSVIIAEVPAILDTPAVLDDGGNVVTPATYLPQSHWNFWYHGESAEALSLPEPDGGWTDAYGLFERTNILDKIDALTGIKMHWVAINGDPIPPGYQTPDGCRLYDPRMIATPSLVKQ